MCPNKRHDTSTLFLKRFRRRISSGGRRRGSCDSATETVIGVRTQVDLGVSAPAVEALVVVRQTVRFGGAVVASNAQRALGNTLRYDRSPV